MIRMRSLVPGGRLPAVCPAGYPSATRSLRRTPSLSAACSVSCHSIWLASADLDRAVVQIKWMPESDLSHRIRTSAYSQIPRSYVCGALSLLKSHRLRGRATTLRAWPCSPHCRLGMGRASEKAHTTRCRRTMMARSSSNSSRALGRGNRGAGRGMFWLWSIGQDACLQRRFPETTKIR